MSQKTWSKWQTNKQKYIHTKIGRYISVIWFFIWFLYLFLCWLITFWNAISICMNVINYSLYFYVCWIYFYLNLFYHIISYFICTFFLYLFLSSQCSYSHDYFHEKEQHNPHILFMFLFLYSLFLIFIWKLFYFNIHWYHWL